MRIKLPLDRNIAWHSVFSLVRNITIVPNSCIQVKGMSPVSLVRKLVMLEARGSSMLFSSESWVSMWKECLPTKRVLNWRITHSLKNTHYSRKGETHVSHNTKQYVRGRCVLHLVSPWELSYLLKGILPATQSFHFWGTSPLCHIAAFMWMEKALFFL
jgi:hypothetical protein